MRTSILALATVTCVAASLVAPQAQASPGDAFRLYTGERNRETIYGRVTDERGRPVQAMVELWYYDISQPITVEERDGGPRSIPMDEQYQRTLFHTDFTTPNGWYHVTAIEGDWLVRVHKGPEWTIEEFKVTVRSIDGTTELDGQRHDVTLNHLYDMNRLGWYSGDVHSHSLFSDGSQNPSDMARAWIANGVDFAALTDHNQNQQGEEFEELTSEEFLAFNSVEVTTASPLAAEGKGFGHHIAFDMPYDSVQQLPGALDPENPVIWNRYIFDDASDLQRAIDQTHALGGLYHPTHSCWSVDWPDGTLSSWAEVKNFDAVDVFTGWDVGPHLPTVLASEYGGGIFGTAQFNMNTVCTQIWYEFLNAGNRIAAWANSDTHDVNSLLVNGAGAPVYWRNTAGNARIYVRSGKLRKRPVKEALREGRAFVTSGYWGPLLLVQAEGRNMPGDTVRVRRNGQVRLRIEVLSNRPLEGYDAGVRVIQNGELVEAIPTHTFEGEMTARVGATITAERDGWVVVEAFGKWPSMAMTNAIYLDVAPYGDHDDEWQVPEDADKWFNPFATVDDSGECTLNIPDQTVPDMLEPTPPHPLPPVKKCQYRVFR